MSHFYGTIQGNRGEATRCGSKESGMETYCASWKGAIRTYAWFNKQQNEDWVRVTKTPWQGQGEEKLLYEGPIGRNYRLEEEQKRRAEI